MKTSNLLGEKRIRTFNTYFKTVSLRSKWWIRSSRCSSMSLPSIIAILPLWSTKLIQPFKTSTQSVSSRAILSNSFCSSQNRCQLVLKRPTSQLSEGCLELAQSRGYLLWTHKAATCCHVWGMTPLHWKKTTATSTKTTNINLSVAYHDRSPPRAQLTW